MKNAFLPARLPIVTALLDAKNTLHPQKVNRAVSFNALKTQAFALLMGSLSTDVIIQKLTTFV